MRRKKIVGFGCTARSGKDECVQTILRERPDYNIVQINFADGLRTEVLRSVAALVVAQDCSVQEAMQYLCRKEGVAYDPNAPRDNVYFLGKNRPLYASWGQRRRDEDPNYWIRIWRDKVDASEADVVLVSDLRYPNEAETIENMLGTTVRVSRVGYGGLSPEQAAHPSETSLDDYWFDYEISVHDGELTKLQKKALKVFDEIMETWN